MRSELSLDIKKDLYTYIANFISDNKRNKFDEFIHNRTRYLTVVLENIFQSQNASAVLRTCDCFGIQDVHIIENEHKYEINPDVELGSAKWLNLNYYNEKEHNTLDAINALRNNGYRIIATTPHKNDLLLEDLPIDDKVALLFGTEKDGLSDIAIQNADAYVKIPMYGFTESFNISVSAALSVFNLSERIRKSTINWQLTEEEIVDVKINWASNVLKDSERIKNNYLRAKFDLL